MARRAVLLAAFAFLLPSLAMAGSVSFTTSGTFGAGNLPITFTGASWLLVDASSPGTNLSFGTFSVTTCLHSPTCSGPESFTLHIDQTSPTIGGGNLDATVTGVVKFNSNQGDYTISWTKATLTIGAVVYSIPFPEALNLGSTTLNGHVSVPEPTANLLLGLGAVALMGFAMVSRKMINI